MDACDSNLNTFSWFTEKTTEQYFMIQSVMKNRRILSNHQINKSFVSCYKRKCQIKQNSYEMGVKFDNHWFAEQPKDHTCDLNSFNGGHFTHVKC